MAFPDLPYLSITQKKGSENTPTHNQHDVQTQKLVCLLVACLLQFRLYLFFILTLLFSSVEEGQGWVQQIAQQMLATRQQVGLQGPPSQELMDAEKRLTEVN